MKKIFYLLAIISFVLGGCSSLDLDPIDNYNADNYWQNQSQVDAFMVALHSRLRDDNISMLKTGEFRSGLYSIESSTFLGTSAEDLEMKQQLLDEDYPGYSGWVGYYNDILQINFAIQKIETDCEFLNTEDHNAYLGQLYGLRALYYFHLYRLYGGVPIVKTPELIDGKDQPADLYQARNKASEVMAFLKEDIDKSASYFKDDDFTITANRDFWNKGATLMLKAEIYLWSAKVSTDDYTPNTVNSDLDIASKALDDIDASGKFSLESSWSNLWDYENKGNSEMIFVSHYQLDEMNFDFLKKYYYDDSFIGNFYSAEGEKYQDTLNSPPQSTLRHEFDKSTYNAFLEGDPRRDFCFLPAYKIEGADTNQKTVLRGLIFKKFMGTVDVGIRELCDDWPIFRYAELVLMRAEIANMKGEDVSIYINMLRERAYGNEDYPKYINSDFNTNEKTINQEYNYEFLGEGKAWFNAVRMHGSDGSPLLFDLKILPKGEAYKILWPIDINTQSKNPLIKQNPGY